MVEGIFPLAFVFRRDSVRLLCLSKPLLPYDHACSWLCSLTVLLFCFWQQLLLNLSPKKGYNDIAEQAQDQQQCVESLLIGKFSWACASISTTGGYFGLVLPCQFYLYFRFALPYRKPADPASVAIRPAISYAALLVFPIAQPLSHMQPTVAAIGTFIAIVISDYAGSRKKKVDAKNIAAPFAGTRGFRPVLTVPPNLSGQ